MNPKEEQEKPAKEKKTTNWNEFCRLGRAQGKTFAQISEEWRKLKDK